MLNRSIRSKGRRGPLAIILSLSLFSLLGFLLLAQTAGAQMPYGGETASLHGDSPRTTATVSPTCGPAWRVVSSPNVGSSENFLFDVDTVSANDIWAVGRYDDGFGTNPQTLTMHWNGTQWSAVRSPNVGSEWNELHGVTAVSANDVWAVGYSGNGYNQPLIMHWNGTQWSVVPSPNPGASAVLYKVAAIRADNIWAVGDYYSSGRRTLTMHWDGTQWSVVPSPNVGTGDNYLNDVAAYSPNNVWAVGYSNGHQTLAMRWDGTQWSVVPTPGIYGVLNGVAIASRTEVWAVGMAESGTLVIHWNGSQWSVVPSPRTLDVSELFEVTAISPNDIWAVGLGFDVDEGYYDSLALHWNGAQWSIVPSPDPGLSQNIFQAVAYLSANDVWAVGVYSDTDNSGGPYYTLTERYSNTCATPGPNTPTATPTNLPTYTPTPTATPSCTVNHNYLVAVSTGATIVPANNYVPGSTCDSCTVNIPLPFTYQLYDTLYTSVNASNKGNLQFTTNNATGASTCLPSSAMGDTIFAYWGNLNTNINDTMGIYTSVSGTAPNRVFNIRWAAGYVANDAREEFEVRLYEGQARFEIIYLHPLSRRGFSATVGVQKGGDPARFTQYECNTYGTIQPGMRLVFDGTACTGAAVKR